MAQKKARTLAEPFRIKMVEPIRIISEELRGEAILKCGYNPFLLHSDDVFIDLLTDSGTGAMSDKQWAGIMIGDESYAGARSWRHLESVTKELTGMPFILPTHQGRAAERILYGILGGKGKVFFSNSHFDTTRANIEVTGSEAIDVLPDDPVYPDSDASFKGNINVSHLEKLINQYGPKNTAAVIMTLTNNSSGGQPVSIGNIREVRRICDRNKLLLIIDGCRIAENSYFVKHKEPGHQRKTYEDVARETVSYADAFVMSAKKDGLVNIGGLLALRDRELFRQCTNLLIISEGFTTYGGLAGRDMEAMAIGLKEVFDPDYLQYRIRSTAYLGEHLKAKGIPVVWPIGGHAVYIDAKRLYPQIAPEHYPGQALVCDLYVKGGIRCVEVGSLMFGRYDSQGKLIPAKNELVRLAIPRRTYTQSHIDYVIDVFEDILEVKENHKGYKIVYELPTLRHFTARLEPL